MLSTAAGPINASDLGATLMHEHVFVMNPELVINYPESLDTQGMIDAAIRKFQSLKEQGIDSIVDLTVMGQGRNVNLVEQVAKQVALNIIVATGWYTFNDAPTFAVLSGPGRLFGGADRLTEMFIHDIRVGVGNSRIRASVLKCATDAPGMTDGVTNIMNSIAEAHQETGALIMTHSDPSKRNGIEQQEFFKKHGVDLTKVVIGHSGDSSDISYLRQLADHGSTLGMDRFGLESRLDYSKRIETVTKMCKLGYSDRMVLSTDSSAFSMNFPHEFKTQHFPSWDASLIMERVVTDLKREGVSNEQIDQMLVNNPHRLLTRI